MTARVINKGNTKIILQWLSEFLRYVAKLSKYENTQVLKFIKSILNKPQYLDQRQILFSLFPFTRESTLPCVHNLVKIVQFTNNNELKYKLISVGLGMNFDIIKVFKTKSKYNSS